MAHDAANCQRRGADGEPTGQPRSWVAEVRPPLEGHDVHEEAHGRPVLRSAVEHHTEVHPELGEVVRNTQESSGSSELHHSNAGEVLVSDAMRTTVSSVIGAFAATSARPCRGTT